MLYVTGTFLFLLYALRFPQNIVGSDKNSESLSINMPKGLFPSPGAKLIMLSPFSAISGSCNKVSVTPEGRSSTSHQLSSSLSIVSEFIELAFSLSLLFSIV